ncbi:MAG TPA: dihydrolipoamide acetyltransferase family protein [Pyrinomonadaceae bacterium]|nr:dihydrolipoamide acetyltransferase family protein [Pyrinomonadaceae bacterium]
MSTEVVMPQMGESIAEGTITRWLKKVGERVERDEPLFEISTDKVDAEIPSPAAGTLTEVLFQEGDTVEVNKVVAYIGDGNGAASGASGAATTAATPAPPPSAPAGSVAPASQAAVSAPAPPPPPSPAPQTQPSAAASQGAPAAQTPPAPTTATTPAASPDTSDVAGRSYDDQRPGAKQEGQTASTGATASATGGDGGPQSVEDLRRTRSSPLVRKIAAEHKIDITQLEGTGASGRVTKNDILSFIEQGGTMPAPQEAPAAQPEARPSAPQTPVAPAPTPVQPGTGDRVEPMSVMRRKIAEHMIMSQNTSAHVATVYEIDMTRIARLRDQHKRAFQERTGTKLTYMPFIFQAVTSAIRKFPIFNSQVSGDQIIYKRDINLGMAVALDWGLIVPVIKRADDLSISGLARAANDLADRARSKQLKPDDVAGGTFTITNPGVFGGLFGTPIINQPQVAILGIGTIEKRPKVITTPEGDDLIAIRHMAYFALSFDHRIIDGADAERFLAYVKQLLEAGQFQV